MPQHLGELRRYESDNLELKLHSPDHENLPHPSGGRTPIEKMRVNQDVADIGKRNHARSSVREIEVRPGIQPPDAVDRAAWRTVRKALHLRSQEASPDKRSLRELSDNQ